jgi:hypothetical protein
VRKPRSPDSVFEELQQQISCTGYAAGLLSLLSEIERFAEPHQTALAALWFSRWRGCALHAIEVRSKLRRQLPDICGHCGAGSEGLIPVAWGYPASGVEAAQVLELWTVRRSRARR